MIQVSLTNAEEKVVHHTANKRFTANRSAGFENKKMGPQSNEFIDINGFGGELAFCKAMNLYPDFKIVPGGVGLVDAVLRDGRRVDVKTSKHPLANLIARKIPADVDIFVLVRGEIPDYEIVGYTTPEELERSRKDLGYGLTYFMLANDLSPIEDLYDHHK